MLTEQDRQAIDACTTRPESVWVVIKEIAIKKYDEYLTLLEPTCNTSARQSEFKGISDRWETVKDNQAKKEEFLSSEVFDSDLCYVLKAVAQRLHGLSTKFMNIEPYIKNWHNNRTVDRRTAFIVSIGFGFDIEETRRLLYNVLDDDEQMDFNPRLTNEMIYAYAIINGIPLTAKSKKIDGKEVQQTSVENMLYEAKIQFLKQLFGNADADYFPELIEVADSNFNILDSVNMTKSALFLASIKTESVKKLLKNIADESKENSSHIEEETTQVERRPKLLPDITVMQRCYEFVSYDQDDEYCIERVAKPVFRDSQILKDSYIDVLKYVISVLKTAQKQVNPKSNGSVARKSIYSNMQEYIEHCVEYVQKQPENSLLSIMDFLLILEESKLGEYNQSEITAMIDTIIVKKLVDEWKMHCEGNIRSTSYHDVGAKFSGDQVEYFRFFFNTLKVAIRDLRAITARGCHELWPAYIEMNRILKYSYFSVDGVGMKLWEYDEMVNAERSDYTGKLEYTYTVDKLQYNLDDAENMPDPADFIANLLSDIHCFELFNHAMISRGKNAFVSGLDKEGEGKIIGRTRNALLDSHPLFLLREDDTFAQDDDLKSFYHYRRFQKQYYEKTTAFSRSDILKLAFWDFIVRRKMKKYIPKFGPGEFIDYFDTEVAPDTCCAEINESNSLDRFLLLCLEHEDPIQFLKETIIFYKTLPKKDSRDFWKMLR